MRTFIILCLVAAACADKLGYNYRPVAHSDNGLSFQPGADSYNGGAATNDAPSYAPQGGELEKEFYSFSANDEDFNEPAGSSPVSSSLKRGLRVIFIKGPENNGLENAALNLAKQAAEQQTAIYVLHKQADIGDLANKLNAARNDNNQKPEVHFVKYRTPEDAANAQHAIQSQYDSLGGSSQSHNGGVAPVINFASQAPVASNSPASYGGSASAPSASYLPASILRRFRL
ncbi:uncharacterized protein LOC119685083 [Teleopsis dalmanni]|uniref:uncharacterized protein LOC119685083 n=1 Tax=Teleopsis dalmanni TaxID=139649 RepID=UPI0018CD1E90|nr:uncharacterized protein LOC119685083 [Teleopsis dalmanni]